MDAFRVVSPGSLTTVQDLGRYGFIDRGVPPSGALDLAALRIANLLVGNPEGAAALEVTMLGPTLEVLCDAADVALTGADMDLSVNRQAAPMWRTLRVRKGDLIRIGQARSGCRACLAVTGGIDVPLVMGSRSTCVKAKIGGVEGRAIRKGDILRRFPADPLRDARSVPQDVIPAYSADIVLRAIPGPQEEAFGRGLDTFFGSSYDITPESDRMGCRLQGPPVHHDEGFPQSIISEPTIPGNVQLPADGQPIILLVEQTTGGYTKIATVISSDISKIAQAIPGNRVRFQRVSLEEAHGICREQALRMRELAARFDPVR